MAREGQTDREGMNGEETDGKEMDDETAETLRQYFRLWARHRGRDGSILQFSPSLTSPSLSRY